MIYIVIGHSVYAHVLSKVSM